MTDIAKVLAMPECEHLKWVHGEGLISDNDYNYYLEGGIPSQMILADLAFRLRDEADKKYKNGIETMHPMYMPMNHIWGLLEYETTYGFESFWLYQAQPIHWILAALKAKEKRI